MVNLRDSLFRILRKLDITSDHSYVNLAGDRDVEWSWIASQMPSGSGKALDFGCGPSYLALIAARRGFDVTAVDLQPIRMPYIYPRLRFIQGDVLHRLSEAVFDLVINCSTIEHVGLAGRYGVTENRSGGDIEAMARLQKLMKADGVMLLTIPVGQDAVFAPYHRVYGKKRLPQLLDGYIVSKEEFWIKDESNRWLPCDKEAALDFGAEWNSRKKVYALGLFVLGRP